MTYPCITEDRIQELACIRRVLSRRDRGALRRAEQIVNLKPVWSWTAEFTDLYVRVLGEDE